MNALVGLAFSTKLGNLDLTECFAQMLLNAEATSHGESKSQESILASQVISTNAIYTDLASLSYDTDRQIPRDVPASSRQPENGTVEGPRHAVTLVRRLTEDYGPGLSDNLSTVHACAQLAQFSNRRIKNGSPGTVDPLLGTPVCLRQDGHSTE